MNSIQMEKACNIAEKKTQVYCAKRGIEVYVEEENGDTSYTEEAQDIFNRYYDEVEQEFCPRCIEDYQDSETGEEKKGTEELSDCAECGVCKDCEHLSDCSHSK